MADNETNQGPESDFLPTVREAVPAVLLLAAIVWILAASSDDLGIHLAAAGQAVQAIGTLAAVSATVFALQQLRIQRETLHREFALRTVEELRRQYGAWIGHLQRANHEAIDLCAYLSGSRGEAEFAHEKLIIGLLDEAFGDPTQLELLGAAEISREDHYAVDEKIQAAFGFVRDTLHATAATRSTQPFTGKQFDEFFEEFRRLQEHANKALRDIVPRLAPSLNSKSRAIATGLENL